MAPDAQDLRGRFESIRTPSRLFDPVETILDGLNSRVLRESVNQAAMRAPDGAATLTVERDDLLSAVRSVLAEVSTEIDWALDRDKLQSFKRAS